MSQIAQLSEAEIEERFHVTGTLPISFLLVGYARAKDQFTVSFGGGQEMMLTTLLDAEPAGDRLVFDCSGSADINRRFLESGRNVFIGRPAGIPVQFTTGQASEVVFEGQKAFAVSLPKFVVRLQRRETFRIETPRVRPLELFVRLPSNELFKCPLHDISVSGIGLTANSVPDGVAVGMVLQNCRLALPGEITDLFFSVTVRNVIELGARSGASQFRIGMQFNDLSNADANRIQRYISRLERERRELL
jgi:c-di-GMP-binding flagellar brake protein YcgR